MALYNYALGLRDTATGTVAHGADGALVGTTTAFTTELSVGDVIEVAGAYRVVTVITDDTHLSVNPNWDDTVSGEAYRRYQMQNIEDFGIPGETGFGAGVPTPAPKSSFQPWSQPLLLASGALRGAGWPTAEWRWGVLSQMARDRLSLFCVDGASNILASNFVAVRTRVNAGGASGSAVYRTFVGELVWPAEEIKDAGRRLDFALLFQALELVV